MIALMNKKTLFLFFIFLFNSNQFIGQKVNGIPVIDLTFSIPEFSKLEDKQFSETNIYWIGEMHGTIGNYDIAIKYFKYLVESQGIDYILIEDSFLGETLLNKYLETGNKQFLNESFIKSKGTMAYNEENKAYLTKIYQIYKQRPSNKRFKFVSIDVEHSYNSSHRYLKQGMGKCNISDSTLVLHNFIDREIKTNAEFISFYRELNKDLVEREQDYRTALGLYYDSCYYMVRNINYYIILAESNGKNWNKVRDSLIYENFKYKDKFMDFRSKKSFAFWGVNHCYQSEIKGDDKCIAAWISGHNPEFLQHTTVILYSKCKFILPRYWVPKGLRFAFNEIDDNFFVSKFQNNDIVYAKLKDIKHLKRVQSSNISLWRVSDFPPDWNFIIKKKKNLKTADYIQNVILLMKSEHCTPL
jgi:hypothetical protein